MSDINLIGQNCVSIVDQAVNELKDRVSITAVIFDCDDQYWRLCFIP